MIEQTEINELIERIEAADEPTAELFYEAFEIVNKPRPATNAVFTKRAAAAASFSLFISVKAWNDAAMMMMPHHWAIERSDWWPPTPDDASNAHNGKSSVSLVKQSYSRWRAGERTWGHSGADPRVAAKASHPALALLAASLKAATVS